MPTEVSLESVHEPGDPEAVARAEAIRADTESRQPSAALKLLERSLERQHQSLLAERAQLDAERANLNAERKAFRDECAKERDRIAEERTKAIASLEQTNKAVVSAQEHLETTTRMALRAAKDLEEMRPKEQLGKIALELLFEKGTQLFSEAMEHGARRQLTAGDGVGGKLDDMRWLVVRQIVRVNNDLAELCAEHGEDNGIAWLKEQLSQQGWKDEKGDLDTMTLGQARKVIEAAKKP